MTEPINPTQWMILGDGVLLLRVGLAMQLCGVSRSKNAAGAIFRPVVDAAVAILVFWAVGAALLHGQLGMILDWKQRFNAAGFFQASAILLGTGIALGTMLERSRFRALSVSSILLAGLIIPLSWRWAQRGWLHHLGLIDAGGATFIHWAGGLVAAVGAYVVGPRNGKHNRDGSSNVIPGHNIALVSAGVLLTLGCWIFYLAGTARVFADPNLAGTFAINVLLAGAAGTLGALLYSRLRYFKADVFLCYSGMLGGLVAISAGAPFIATRWAVLTGVIAGFIVALCTVESDLTLKLDDPTAGVSVHAVGALVGTLMLPMFTSTSIADFFRRLGVALLALLVIGALAAGSSLIGFVAMKKLFGIRPREADEFDGLDLAEHDLNAYPDFQQTTIKSYHLREA